VATSERDQQFLKACDEAELEQMVDFPTQVRKVLGCGNVDEAWIALRDKVTNLVESTCALYH
jgi:hypothetical protein